MTLVGTIINRPGISDSTGPTDNFVGGGDPLRVTALLDGNTGAKI